MTLCGAGDATTQCSVDVKNVNDACCESGAGGSCTSGGIPTTCTAACAPVFVGFWSSCKGMFDGDEPAKTLFSAFSHQCRGVLGGAH